MLAYTFRIKGAFHFEKYFERCFKIRFQKKCTRFIFPLPYIKGTYAILKLYWSMLDTYPKLVSGIICIKENTVMNAQGI